ncbi:MAG: hypothetical protein R3F11_17880 [Verrucomicrobiales bacterium]
MITRDRVLDVSGAFAQMRVFDLADRFEVAADDFEIRVFDVEPVVLDQAQDLVVDHAILEDEQVRVEDARLARSDLAGELVLELTDLGVGLGKRTGKRSRSRATSLSGMRHIGGASNERPTKCAGARAIPGDGNALEDEFARACQPCRLISQGGTGRQRRRRVAPQAAMQGAAAAVGRE